MKIYAGYPIGITKISRDKDFYQTEDLSNVITVYVNKADVTGITYFLSLEFLRPDGRKTTISTRDAFAAGDDTTYTEDGVTYDIHNFTLTETQLAVAGTLAFTCYITISNNGTIIKRGVLFNAISNVRKTVGFSAETIFIVDEDEDDVPIIVADMKAAIDSLNALLAGKIDVANIIDDLTHNDSDKVLSAKQGKVLKDLIDALDAGKQDVLTFDSTPTANSTNPVTSGGVKTALDTKADSTTVSGIDNRVGALENEITDLQSVQNVVDVVATKSALNSYDTSKLEENDKIQVIADETHGDASTIYNWTGSAWQYVGAYGTNSYTKPETLEQIDLHKLVSKTYSELATMKTGNNLVPGQLYRITDYVTLTNGKCNNVGNDARSAQHQFDIIVRAISTNKLSEQARAIQHAGDAYFGNSNLQAWKLWYCFDNDSVRFEWADTSTGKGVIYRMIDEFGNDLPYDFKNIQFKRYKITATSDQRQALFVGKYLGFSGNYAVVSDSSDYVWYYTFSKRSDGSDLSLTETTASDIANSYYVKQVIMGQYLTDTPNYRGAQALNNIVMEADNIIVDVQMGAGSHHNTWIGNADIDYCYFGEMFRQNILYGEINHTRADECFERNVMGEGHYSNYTSCWNKFSHHFSQNTSLNLQSNDFENQVGNCKFPAHFTRNHVSNMWDNVNAGTHDTFNRCEFGYMVNVTLSGAGDWDSVKTIMCYNVTIKIANFYGSNLGRMEYVSISEGEYNGFNILNLTIGAIYGSSSKTLTIALTDISTHNLQTSYEKRIDYAYNSAIEGKVLIYQCAVQSVTYQIIDYDAMIGIVSSVDGTVSWSALDSLSTKFGNIATAFNNKMNKGNPDGTGAMTMNGATASNYGYANGSGATASGMFSEARGFGATASGSYSTAVNGTATGSNSVAYGHSANASGDGSFALGTMCYANGNNQVVTGKFNIPDTDSLEIVGNGAYMNTKNARVLDSKGNEFLAGDIYLDTEFTKDENGDLLSKQGMSVKQAIKNIQSALDGNLYNETDDSGIAYEVALSNPLPYGKVNKVGGMSYKSENLIVLTDVAETTTFGITYSITNGTATVSGASNTGSNANFYSSAYAITNLVVGKTYYFANFTTSDIIGVIGLYDGTNWVYKNAGGTFTYSQSYQEVRLYLQAVNGTTYTNVEVSPMLVEGTTAPTTWSEGFSGIRNTAVSQLKIIGVNHIHPSNDNSYFQLENLVNGNTYTFKVFTNVYRIKISTNANATADNVLNGIENASGVSQITFTYNTSKEWNIYIWAYGTPTTPNAGLITDVRPYNSMLVNGSTAPTEYKPYVTPIIKPIPSEIQALDGYGWGINDTCYNYIDFATKKFVKNVGRVDMGTLDWFISSGIFVTNLSDIKLSPSNVVGNIMCANYTSVAWSNIEATDKSICVISTATQIRVNDTDYTTASTFKTAMSGVYLLYELETPIETDISEYLTDENYDVLSNLEPNGSITLDNTYQQEAVYDITTLEKVSV